MDRWHTVSGSTGELTQGCWQTYLPILERAGLGEEALRVYAYMQRGNRMKGPYASFWFAKVMGAAAGSGAVGKAMTVYEDAVRHRVDVRGQTFVRMLAACEVGGVQTLCSMPRAERLRG